jgi:nitroimidazol reductase NimA-like FMN-containing flavoprotein (pyridoxamine 5'-phosphate oxidase superfamily)
MPDSHHPESQKLDSQKLDSHRGTSYAKTDRTRVKRSHKRARYDREAVHAVLDAGFMCHVAYVIDGQPFVTPTAYWREGERVYWHGSSASRMIRAVRGGIPVCFNVALFDGLVLAKSGFHTSVNYRSVTVYGEARQVEGREAKEAALEAFFQRIMPGRWETLRAPTGQEMKATSVLWMPLEEAVAKIRQGGPIEDEADERLPIWSGVVPIQQVVGAPETDPLSKGLPLPDHLGGFKLG